MVVILPPGLYVFLSTLPAWGATSLRVPVVQRLHGISIHAPRVGSDADSLTDDVATVGFLSTLPAWGATGCFYRDSRLYTISIHAPRVGSDLQIRFIPRARSYFYPRSPRGERRQSMGSSTTLN